LEGEPHGPQAKSKDYRTGIEAPDPLYAEWRRLSRLIAEKKRAGASREELRDLRKRRALVFQEREEREKTEAAEVNERMDAWEADQTDEVRREYLVVKKRFSAALQSSFLGGRGRSRKEHAARRREFDEALAAQTAFERRYGAPDATRE